MRGLNKYLARRANAEDGCKGCFWTVERIRRLQPQSVSAPQEAEGRVPVGAANVQPPLMPLVKASQDDHVHVLGYTERDYLELVDWAGRAIRADKRHPCRRSSSSPGQVVGQSFLKGNGLARQLYCAGH